MLLFDQTKALEKALGAEAAEVIAKIFEAQHEELANKRDLKELENILRRDMAEMKTDLVKWLVGIGLAQVSILVAILKLFK